MQRLELESLVSKLSRVLFLAQAVVAVGKLRRYIRIVGVLSLDVLEGLGGQLFLGSLLGPLLHALGEKCPVAFLKIRLRDVERLLQCLIGVEALSIRGEELADGLVALGFRQILNVKLALQISL